MKYIITFFIFALLFAQCSAPDITVYPTGTYDTLGVQWMTIERNNITYYFQGTGVKGASIFTDLHEDAYEQVNTIFNTKMPQKLRFFVWTDWEAARQTFNIPEDVGGFAISEECVCHTRADIPLAHEMTHVISYWSGGVEPSSYTKFINEGIAVAFDLEGDDKIETAKKAITQKYYPGVAAIWYDKNEVYADILYPVGGAFVDFLYKKNMPDKFFKLIKNQTIEDAEEIYGKEELSALMAEFNRLMEL